ncbi:peptidoglycan-binding domain-containing protein [Peribacillus simplex]
MCCNRSCKSAVVKFQKSKGLKADGIVGPNINKVLGMKKQTSNVSNVNKTSNKSTAIVSEAKKHLNVRYVWGEPLLKVLVAADS